MINYSMEQVNKMTEQEFMHSVGVVFEHSPWVAKSAFGHHPFSSLDQMYEKMIEEMTNADMSLKLSLLRAHPDLGTRLEVSESSKHEQQNAGLSQLSEEEYREFSLLNKKYIEKFDFPFIMAVKGQDKHSIKESMKTRINNQYEKEFKTALSQVEKIARFRLVDMIVDENMSTK
ncbi:2-oxo-4-hydroxy-4-carboxy-5-ureidoimidazoline decarboxylase [Halalkalibacter kiskunsagensis]|uniref:2-oxo-4-hydroxy-4-carboxy-5-ureidoimidazoline decarboxylase n=1 Tax=Halalkalibacter kiskunsagensis TaxID=1548599 RepID=A0ABV6KDS4_9BACI